MPLVDGDKTSLNVNANYMAKHKVYWQLISAGEKVTKPGPLISLYRKFYILQKYAFDYLIHIHIWQLSPVKCEFDIQ